MRTRLSAEDEMLSSGRAPRLHNSFLGDGDRATSPKRSVETPRTDPLLKDS